MSPDEGGTQGTHDAHLSATRSYYDEFSAGYDSKRGGREPGGYHDLVDDLEVDFVEHFARGAELLEVGCGTGLLLERFDRFCARAEGVDLSPGMLEKARARGLTVKEASATALPYPDASFDVTCSFKVLPHVRELALALSEMGRVTRPGGVVIAELYNPWSFRGLAKRLGPAGKISQATKESAVYTKFHTPTEAESALVGALPSGTKIVGRRGVRIVTPAAAAMRVKALRGVLRAAEWALCDSPLRALGGFYVVAARLP